MLELAASGYTQMKRKADYSSHDKDDYAIADKLRKLSLLHISPPFSHRSTAGIGTKCNTANRSGHHDLSDLVR